MLAYFHFLQAKMFTLEAQPGRALPEMLLVCTERERAVIPLRDT